MRCNSHTQIQHTMWVFAAIEPHPIFIDAVLLFKLSISMSNEDQATNWPQSAILQEDSSSWIQVNRWSLILSYSACIYILIMLWYCILRKMVYMQEVWLLIKYYQHLDLNRVKVSARIMCMLLSVWTVIRFYSEWRKKSDINL